MTNVELIKTFFFLPQYWEGKNDKCAGFEVFIVVTLKVTIFWDVMSCRLVHHYWYFRGTYASSFRVDDSSALKMKAALPSRMSMTVYQRTCHHVPEDSNLLLS
jgi:hypothetical protein